MATVESTRLGLCADGKTGWYKVVFTDATDSTIMENGSGFTLTGDQAGAKSCSPVKIPRVEIRNTKTVVSGAFELNNDEHFEWEEILTATGLAGALFSSETTSTESAAFTGVSVVNRSRANASGEPHTNLRRTRFIRGSVPAGFTTAPTLTLDADEETAGTSVAVTDQVSGLTTKFNNDDGGTNSFEVVADRYGSGRNAIKLTLNDAIRNTDAIDVSGGVTYHWVMESDATGVRAGQFVNAGSGQGIVLEGNERMYVRGSFSAATTPSRANTDYAVVTNAVRLYSLVIYTNGDRVLYVDGRPYCSFNTTAPTGTVTNELWIDNHGGTGNIFVRRLDIIEDALTEEEVYADQDYYANVIYASDEDLNGSLACYVSESGTSSGTGRFNDPVNSITATTMRSGDGSWLSKTGTRNKDVCVLVNAGDKVEIGSVTVNGSNEDPMYPWHIGAYGTVSAANPLPILNFVDPNDNSTDDKLIFPSSGTETDEFAFISVEVASDNRNFRADGTATAADALIEEVFLLQSTTNNKGIQFVNFVCSSITGLMKDSAGSLTDQDFSFQNLECWRLAARNTSRYNTTMGSAGSTASIFFYLNDREQTFMKDIIGYEVGWDADVVNSTADQNLWGGSAFDGTATDQPALDNGYSRFGYFAGTYGVSNINNMVSIRDASHDLQFREGGMIKNLSRWEGTGALFWADHDSYGENLMMTGSKSIQGGNLIGHRGSKMFAGGDPPPRLMVLKNIHMDNSSSASVTREAIANYSDRTTVSTYAPAGEAVIRFDDILLYGFSKGIKVLESAALNGYVQKLMIDMTDASSPDLMFQWDNTGGMSGLEISQFTYDLDASSPSTAFAYNGTDGTLADLRTSTGMSITPATDFTSTGFGWSDKRTFTDWCTTVHSFTKVDSGQSDAEELGEQWYEAFADAMREGSDPSAYFATAANTWVDAGWFAASAAPTLSSSTPADGATGVLDTADLVLVFSEDIAYNDATALIEVYQGGAQVKSAQVGTGTINISDKTEYTLTGLLTGLSGAVSIRIGSTAFKSVSTGIAYAGISNDTTLDFTIGTASGNRSRDRSRAR